ncbi:hypothetical protein CALCODRAFT_500817 [Calocera cornea HHB12733]|uniref:F-box domain-containing protein n=1 Tax=Calocera cornea HHB12733 TaxID=1353952 RepID=A0A165DWE9_9BASI|nr:hypothetical protein CALCODRAFT_500817 [Calocera cornea HHB12733]
MLRNCPDIRELNLEQDGFLHDGHLSQIGKRWPDSEFLFLDTRGGWVATMDAFMFLLMDCQRIDHLSLSVQIQFRFRPDQLPFHEVAFQLLSQAQPPV